MKPNRFAMIAIIIVFLGVLVSARAEILGDYLSVTACMECHEDVVSGWKTTAHARAFGNLKTQGSEKQSNPGCVKCHVVAYDRDGGFIDMDLTPELKDVQCEACHGPGRGHVESGGDPSLIAEKPGETVCRACHTEGQDKRFDYSVKSKFVHGAKR